MQLARSLNVRRGILLLVLGLVFSACGSPRPTVSEWESRWASVVALIPAESALADDPESTCEAVLVSLREQKETLFPAPDELLDETVRQWLEVAEGTFFDCPPAGGFNQAYAQLDELAAEVDAGLTSSTG